MWNITTLKQIKIEIDNIRNELQGIPLSNSSSFRIADFGCGQGYGTLALMLALDATECSGVDKNNHWQISIENAKEFFSTVREYPENLTDIAQGIRRLLDEGRWPTFHLGDALSGNNLPKNLDFAYCKLLLGNISDGSYDNLPNGPDGVNQAVRNIISPLKYYDVFCFVEKGNYGCYSEVQNLKVVLLRQIEQISGISESWHGNPPQFIVHAYRKIQFAEE